MLYYIPYFYNRNFKIQEMIEMLSQIWEDVRKPFTQIFCDIDGCPNGEFIFLNAFLSFYIKILIPLNTIWYRFHFLFYILFIKNVICVSSKFVLKIIKTCRRSFFTLYIHLTNNIYKYLFNYISQCARHKMKKLVFFLNWII